MGKIIIRPKKSTSTIGGYDIDYPTQLNGVLTLKEWDMIITIINQNMIRNYVSSWIVSVFIFIFIGLLLFLVMAIVNLIRWSDFKSKAENDLITVLSSLNSQLSVKGVSIGYKRSEATFTLEINYPDHLTRPIDMNRIYKKYSFKPVLLDTYAGSIPFVNPDIHKQPYHPCDPRLRSLLIPAKCTSSYFQGFEGWEVKSFPYALYNYLTPQEYAALLRDYNSQLTSRIESKSWKFFIVSSILCIFLIGLILIIPALIWLSFSVRNYRLMWNEKLESLNNKYTQLYASRGLSFHFHPTGSGLPRGFLNIHAPLDCGNAPTFTLMEGKKQAISATIPGQLEPMYVPNGQLQAESGKPEFDVNYSLSDTVPNSTDIDIDCPTNENTPLINKS